MFEISFCFHLFFFFTSDTLTVTGHLRFIFIHMHNMHNSDDIKPQDDDGSNFMNRGREQFCLFFIFLKTFPTTLLTSDKQLLTSVWCDKCFYCMWSSKIL